MSVARRIRALRLQSRLLRDASWALAWCVAVAFVEVSGRQFSSEPTDLMLMAGLVSLGGMTLAAHARAEIAWWRAAAAALERLRHLRTGFWGACGIDLRGGADIAAGLPPTRRRAFGLVAGVAACAVAAAPWLPTGLRAAGAATSYTLYLVGLGAVWGLAGFAVLGLSFFAAGVIGDARIRAADNAGRSRSGRSPSGRLVLAQLALAIALALSPAPALVPAAGVLGCVAALALLSAQPRFRRVHLIWRRAGGPPRRASLGAHMLLETSLVGMACLTIVTLASGLEVGAPPQAGDFTFSVRLARAAAWAAVFGLGGLAWRVAALAGAAARTDPGVARAPLVRFESPNPESVCTPAARAAVVADGWRVLGPRDPAVHGEVRVDPGARDLSTHAGRIWLARRHEIVQRRLLRRGLQRIFRAAARFSYDRGTGFWIAPHLWLVPAMSRDEEESDSISKGTGAIDQVLGPDHEHAFPASSRAYLRRVLDALDVDLVFVEDGVRWRGLRRVLDVLFEVYDRHGGTRCVQDRDFAGLTGLRIVLHDFNLDNPYRAEGYPEPDYEDVARARLLHVFRDRGGQEDDVRAPAPGDRVPLLV